MERINVVKITDMNVIKAFLKTANNPYLSKDEKNQYYGVYIDDTLVSIASIYQMKNGEIRFKSNYTLVNYRGNGYMTMLIKYILANIQSKKYSAHCFETSYKIYYKLGFVQTALKHYKHFDIYEMKKEVK